MYLNIRTVTLSIIIVLIQTFPSDIVVAQARNRLVKVLVASPYVQNEVFEPVADVMAGCIIRELKRHGGMEIISREEAEEYIHSQGGVGSVANREQAIDVGTAVDADIVIYSTLFKNQNAFIYNIVFLQVQSDIVQRVLNGNFPSSTSASDIGRIMKRDVEKLTPYIPLPSELADPGMNIRETTIDPLNIPKSHVIENFPPFSRYGYVEQVFNYYRVFPGEEEYDRLMHNAHVMKFIVRENMDEELTARFDKYNTIGDFAIRHNLQAYFIKDCSTQAMNVLIANNIPIFYADDVIVGYFNYMADGFSIFRFITGKVLDTTLISHRDRMVMMIMLPKPGRKGGISREYLESAISLYPDEWGKTPKLVEISKGILDFDAGIME